MTSSSFEVLIHFRPPLLYCGNFISKHELPQGQRKKSCIVIRHPAAWPRAVFDLWGCSIYANELLSSQEQFPEKEGQRFFIMSLGLHHSVWKSLLKVSFYKLQRNERSELRYFLVFQTGNKLFLAWKLIFLLPAHVVHSKMQFHFGSWHDGCFQKVKSNTKGMKWYSGKWNCLSVADSVLLL